MTYGKLCTSLVFLNFFVLGLTSLRGFTVIMWYFIRHCEASQKPWLIDEVAGANAQESVK